ncbi:hypothetical protein Pfo_009640 [Paulownia fortunei]|nr:hypothetical protein Pfo_009640 [Paulownia fortunei]
MFTTRRQWPGLSIAPQERSAAVQVANHTGKGKMVAFSDGLLPPPPTGLLSKDMDTAFREVGLLDEAALERRDRDALVERIQRLERDVRRKKRVLPLLLLRLLLINQPFFSENLRRTHGSGATIITNCAILRNLLEKTASLVTETAVQFHLLMKLKQTPSLERSLREICGEHEKIKMATNLELDRRLQELETRESVLRRERMSFNSERDAHQATFVKHKDDMREGERKLQEGETLSEMFEEKDRELVEEQKKVELANSTLKRKEDDAHRKLADLTVKEEKAESIRTNLEMKEKEFITLTEKLSAGERVCFGNKRQVFELEMEEEKRKLLDEAMKVKHHNLDMKASEINHMDEKLKKTGANTGKEEQTLEKKSARVKEKEKDIELKLKGLKEIEKSLKVEEKNIELLRSKTVSDKESMQILEDELEKMKAEISPKEAQNHDESEKLRITEAERKEHIRFRVELKQEIERYNRQKDFLFKENWKALDEKTEELTKDSQLKQERRMIEKLKHSGEKQLKEDKLATEDYVKRELESLRLEKELFAATMKHELRDFEIRRRDLEADMLNKQEEVERNLRERERTFEEGIDKERSNISNLKKVVQRETEDMKSERRRLEKDKRNIALNKQQLEMHKDIDELGVLSQKLKLQQQQFINERSRFLTFVETLKSCQNFGDMGRDYMLSDLHISELDKEISPTGPKSLESGGRISWLLQKCTPRIFNLSPNMNVQHLTSQKLDQPLPNSQVNVAENVEEPSMSVDTVARLEDTPEGDSEVQEVLHDSQQSEKPRDGIDRTRSVKAVVEGAEVFLRRKYGDSKPDEEQQKDSPVIEESRGDSSLAGKANDRGSDDADESEGRSESVTAGGHRKRHQTGGPAVPNTGEPCYNLRRHKTGGKAIAASTESERKTNKVGDATVSRYDEMTSAPPVEVASENDNIMTLVQVTSHKNVQTQMVSSNRVVKFQTSAADIAGNADAVKSTENMDLREEVNGTPEYCDEHGQDSTLHGNEEEDGNEYDDNGDEHPGEVSIARKLWTFFTS